MSGPLKISPLYLSIATTTIIRPSCDKCRLSLNTMLPTSPTPRPSTNTWPLGTAFCVSLALCLLSSRQSPLAITNTFFLSIPKSVANFSWHLSILYSPWTGTKYLGFTSAWRTFISSALAWPETWTSIRPSYITSAPFFKSSFITL